MRIEGNFNPEPNRHERQRLGSLSPIESSKLQYELSVAAYARHHQGENISDIPHNKILLWWIRMGFARAYGDYAVEHGGEYIDINDEVKRDLFLEVLEADLSTVH